MKIKELNEIRQKLYFEFIKNEEIKKALDFTNQVYIYEISENQKRKIDIFNYNPQLNLQYLKENGFTKNANIAKLYTINKQTKQAY